MSTDLVQRIACLIDAVEFSDILGKVFASDETLSSSNSGILIIITLLLFYVYSLLVLHDLLILHIFLDSIVRHT